MTSLNERSMGKLLSLLTLALGIAVGYCGRGLLQPAQSVNAQAVLPPTATFKDVAPIMTAGSIGTNLLLAHEIAADSVVINGFDVLKMQQNILEYLASEPSAEKAALQNVINASRATTVYRVKQPTAVPAVQPPAEKK